MELSDLKIFRAVVSEGGVTRAAEHLHRVQSNITTRIRKLEDKLEVQLFFREGKRMQLTPAGRILLEYADRMLELSAEAEAAVRDSRPRGIFRLGSMESTAAIRLPSLLADYCGRYPGVKLELRTGNPLQLSAALLAGEIDAALVAGPVADVKFESVPAFEEETVIITTADHASNDSTKSVPGTMIVFENGCPHRKLLEAWYSMRGQIPERTIELGSYHAMVGCVLAGMGAALLPKSVLGTFPKNDRLKYLSLPRGMDKLSTHYIWRRNAKSPNVLAFSEILATGAIKNAHPVGERV